MRLTRTWCIICAAVAVLAVIGLIVVAGGMLGRSHLVVELGQELRSLSLEEVKSRFGTDCEVEELPISDTEPQDELRGGLRFILKDMNVLNGSPVNVSELSFVEGDDIVLVWLFEDRVIDAVKYRKDVTF